MKSIYLDMPSGAVLALNFKAGSASLARARVALHPELEARVQSAAYPEGFGPENVRWQGIAPKADPVGKVVLLAVREPVEHFRSACAESRIGNVDAKLAALEAEWGRDPHFWPQSRLVSADARETRLYRFPEDLNALATVAGLPLPLPNITGGERIKPNLTPEQRARVLELYSADAALYASIAAPGTLVVQPAAELPPAPGEIGPAQLRIAMRRLHGVVAGQVEAAISAMPAEAQADARDLWEYATSIRRDHPLIAALAFGFGLTDAQIDDVFRLGATL